MRILITNDDGAEAPGIDVLRQIAEELSDDVWVVAPDSDCSGVGHAITVKDPLRLRQISEHKFAVRGTPTDCVIFALRNLLKDKKPDLVLSGVNRGQNIAHDVTYSGTVGGAMEGTLLGIPSIAFSQAADYIGPGAFNWDVALSYGPQLIRDLLETGWSQNVFLNVNFPDCPPDDVLGVKITKQGLRHVNQWDVEEKQDANNFPYYWMCYKRPTVAPLEGTDNWAISNGYISVTPLLLDLTHHETLERFAVQFGGEFASRFKKAV